MEKQMPNEKIYYQDPDVTITNARAIFGEKTYSVSNITSVVKGKIKPFIFHWVILALVAIFFLLSGSPLLLEAITQIPPATQGELYSLILWSVIVFVALVVLIFSIWRWSKAKPTWVVKVSSASGEIDAFSSKDEARIQSIVTGINQSIIERG